MTMREKLIDIVEAYADFLDWDTKEDMVDSIIEKCFATDNNVGDKWISVKDRLPESRDFVLGYMSFGEYRTLKWKNETHRWEGLLVDYEMDFVTHWMPLPQPPKGE